MPKDYSEEYRSRWADTSVRRVLRELITEDQARHAACRQIATSIDLANSVHSGRWGVSLDRDQGFVRVNVGRPEALLLDAKFLWLMVDVATVKQDGAAGFLRQLQGSPAGIYHSVPGSRFIAIPLHPFVDFQRHLRKLARAHRVHIGIACRSGLNGMTRRGHHPGFLDAIAAEANRRLPQPDFVKVARPIGSASGSSRSIRSYREGDATEITQTRYERNPAARRACLEHYGASCWICGFDFESAYGEAAAGLIHVHHRDPLSEQRSRESDAVRDLRPVCPNCHLVIHSVSPALSVETVREMLRPDHFLEIFERLRATS